jgi:hypothetical protein
LNPLVNDHGVYLPNQWHDNIIIGEDNYKKPHCSIAIVKLNDTKWIGSTTFDTATMKCGVLGGGSYPGITDKEFHTKEECIRYHARDLFETFTEQKKHSGWDGFDKIINRLEELGDLKEVKQLTLFDL